MDSVPFSSITSLLEAGSFGLPLLGFVPDLELGLLGPGAPGLDGTMEMGVDADSYQHLLRRLIAEEDFRMQSGHQVREQILTKHTGTGWRRALEDVYLQSRHANMGLLADSPDFFAWDSLNEALVSLYGNSDSNHKRGLLWRYLGALPYLTRLAIIWELYRKGFGLSIFNLLPSPVYLLARTLGRQVRRLRGDRLTDSGACCVSQLVETEEMA